MNHNIKPEVFKRNALIYGKELVNEATFRGREVAKEEARIDTGALYQSIISVPAVVKGNNIYGKISTGIYYAHYQNFGYISARGRGHWVEGTHFMEAGGDVALKYLRNKGSSYLTQITKR